MMRKAYKTAAAMVALMVALSVTAPADMAQTLQQLTGKAEAPEWTAEQWSETFQQALDHLIPLLAAEDVGSRYAHQMTLQAMAAHASRPGADAERQALAAALVQTAGREDLPGPALEWIVRQFELMGREEAVPVLVDLLQHEDRHLSDQARRALEKNPSQQAGLALRQALAASTDPVFRSGVIRSLGQRGDTGVIDPLKAIIAGDNELETLAAVTALGDMATAAAAQALLAAHGDATGRVRTRIEQHALMIAHDRISQGENEEALGVYRALAADAMPLQTRSAALIGRAHAGEAAAAGLVTQAMDSEEAPLRAAAVMAARVAPDNRPTEALAARLDQVTPLDQERILTLVAERAVAACQPHVIKMLDSGEAPVRLAAIDALAAIDRAAGAERLLQIVATGDGAEQRAARRALAVMSGEGVEEALKAHSLSDDLAKRLAAIEVLSERRAEGMREALLAAVGDADPTLGATILKSLEILVVDGDGERIAAVIAAAGDNEAVIDAAEPVLRAAFRLAADKDAVALSVYDSYLAASTAGKRAILRAFSALGGERALSGVSTVAVEAEDPDVRDAAIRSLIAWPDFEAAGILSELAADAELSMILHALTVRGIIRLASEHFGERPDEAVRLVVTMLETSRRSEEKVAALSALAAMPTQESAQAVEKCLDDEALQAEAAQAALRMARRLARTDRDGASALVAKVRALNLSDEINQQADNAFNR